MAYCLVAFIRVNISAVSCTERDVNVLPKFICLPTDKQLNCLKNNFKIYIKIDIKITPTCFGVITIIIGEILLKLYLLK